MLIRQVEPEPVFERPAAEASEEGDDEGEEEGEEEAPAKEEL